MMGSGRQGVSICFTTLRACARMFETLNEIALSIVPTGTTRFTLAGESVLCGSPLIVSSGGETSRAGLLPEAELGLVAPHAMQNHSELACDRDPGSRHTPVLRDLHAPGAQARPFAAAYEQCVRRFVERCAGQLVTASADFALDVRLAGLVARRRQAEMRPDI